MRIFVCDRCGKNMEDDKRTFVSKLYEKPKTHQDRMSFKPIHEIDLCIDCVLEVKKYLEKKVQR